MQREVNRIQREVNTIELNYWALLCFVFIAPKSSIIYIRYTSHLRCETGNTFTSASF